MPPRNVMIEDANVLRGQFRNFAGLEKPLNRAGDRNFCIGLTPEKAQELLDMGFNVKVRDPKEEGDEPLYFLKIFLNFKYKDAPRVYLVTSRGKRELDEHSVQIVDYAEMSKVDLTFREYNWEVNGNTGTKAMLKNMYVHIVEDELDMQYADTPDLEY